MTELMNLLMMGFSAWLVYVGLVLLVVCYFFYKMFKLLNR